MQRRLVPKMTTRRQLLGMLGFAIAQSGCLSTSQESANNLSPTVGPTDSTASTPPIEPPNEIRKSRFHGESCPSLYKRESTCYHSLPNGEPGQPVLIPLEEQINSQTPTFSIVNGSDQEYVTDNYNQNVFKHTDAGWKKITPITEQRPGESVLPPGGVLKTDVRADLGPGRYALWIHGWFRDAPDDEQLDVVALFEVTGEPVTLEATDIATEEVDGNRVYLETQRAIERDDHKTVTFTQDPSRQPTLLPTELAVQSYTLRNALPYLQQPDIQTVEIRTFQEGPWFIDQYLSAAHWQPPFDTHEDPPDGYPTQYQDTAFTVSRP